MCMTYDNNVEELSTESRRIAGDICLDSRDLLTQAFFLGHLIIEFDHLAGYVDADYGLAVGCQDARDVACTVSFSMLVMSFQRGTYLVRWQSLGQ
jgi:hypothetical protein